ncbi:MAG: hypothetical protein R6U85_03505 [Salinivirgaceae bacterium]
MSGIILVVGGVLFISIGTIIHLFNRKEVVDLDIERQDIDEEIASDDEIHSELDSLINLAVVDGVLTKNEHEMILNKAMELGVETYLVEGVLTKRLQETSVNAETKLIDKIKESGDIFEQFVVSKFDTRYFKLKEWAGDKYINGIYAETTTNPDLVLCYSAGKTQKTIAVECKYRSKYTKDGVFWASDKQISNYRNYQDETKITVFVAIGVGGEPCSPEELFIIPLDKLFDRFISRRKMQYYRKNNFKSKNIFLDVDNLRLL